jgi:glycosyltransferase involved in cell wall biosynthesis
MAAYCPVVTTDCDCLAEEFGEVAEIYPLPFDVAGFVAAIERVLDDEARYYELAYKGREFAETRQWKDIAPRWIELFEEQRSLAA